MVLPQFASRTTIHEPVGAFLLARAVRENRSELTAFSNEVLQQISSHTVPGNISEMRLRVENAVRQGGDEMVTEQSFWSL